MGCYDRLPPGATCAVDEGGGPCGRLAIGHNRCTGVGYWCKKHRVRWHRTGDVLLSLRRRDPAAWFWSQVGPPGPNGCREWTSARVTTRGREHGYGIVFWRGRTVGAHRVAYALAYGAWQRGLICHTCDNPPCCEPSHLYDGTRQSNAADAQARGRYANQRKTHCRHGHPLQPTSHPRKRYCPVCHREKDRRRRATRRAAA